MLPTTNTITTGSTTPFVSPQTETIKRLNDNQDLENRVNSVFNQQSEPSPQKERGQTACTTLATKAEVLPQAIIDHLCFSESPTFEFGNAYPCKFEFGGRYYLNAVACFLAQQYSDQSQVMALFANCKTADEARALASQTPMTKERENSWENPQAQHINKNDVMMNVLRAKFGQNLNLKRMLLATGGAYLVCQGNDPYWTDCYNGIGKNALGTCLMRLRGEYQGIGIISPCLSYNNVILSMKEKDRRRWNAFAINDACVNR